MLFNSLEFAIFLALVLTGYFGVIPASFVRTRKGFLVVASYVFYMSWSPPFPSRLSRIFWESRLLNPPFLRTNPLGAFARRKRKLLESYDVPIEFDHPVVKMMGATVSMATRREISILVIVSPIPYETMTEENHYEPVEFRRRIDVLRKVVSDEGGYFLDLHAALRAHEFSDNAGHFNEEGTAKMVRLVEPKVRRLLRKHGRGRGRKARNKPRR